MLLKIFQHPIFAKQLCCLGTRKMLCLLVLLNTEGKKIGNIQTLVAHRLFYLKIDDKDKYFFPNHQTFRQKSMICKYVKTRTKRMKNTNDTNCTNIMRGTKIYMNLAQMWRGVRLQFTTQIFERYYHFVTISVIILIYNRLQVKGDCIQCHLLSLFEK